jgi:hypothetical protein
VQDGLFPLCSGKPGPQLQNACLNFVCLCLCSRQLEVVLLLLLMMMMMMMMMVLRLHLLQRHLLLL